MDAVDILRAPKPLRKEPTRPVEKPTFADKRKWFAGLREGVKNRFKKMKDEVPEVDLAQEQAAVDRLSGDLDELNRTTGEPKPAPRPSEEELAAAYAVRVNNLMQRLQSETGLEIDGSARPYLELRRLISETDPQTLGLLFEPQYDEFWASGGLRSMVGDRLGKVIREKWIEKRKYTDGEEELFGKLFGKFGFTPDEGRNMTKAWLSYNNPKRSVEQVAKKRGEIFVNNINRMESLYSDSRFGEAGLQRLHREFGIRHFSRYYGNQLIDQIRGNVQIPPRVSLAAVSDRNNALGDAGAEAEAILGKSRTHTQVDMGVIYMEAESTGEAARRMLRISRQYGAIKTLLLQAHGNHDFIRLGTESDQILTTEQVEASAGIRRLTERGILEKKAQVIVASCKVGQKGGLVDTLVESGIRAIGPGFITTGTEKTRFNRVKFKVPKAA